jgi:subtilisin family serine protease
MKKKLAIVLLFVLAIGTAAAESADQYLLRVSHKGSLSRVCTSHGLTVAKTLPRLRQLYIVKGPEGVDPAALVAAVRADAEVKSFEPDRVATYGELAAVSPDLQQTTQALDEALVVDRTITDFYGAPAWTGYVRQGAFDLIGVPVSRSAGELGDGVIVAVIDSGIDPDHPLLRGALAGPGYDFTRDQPGASEWNDLDPALASLLSSHACDKETTTTDADTGDVTQSVAAILDSCQAGIVTQSVAAILDIDAANALASTQLPPGFGHGTMVAGLIHALAPRARILPVKAFRADGTGRSSDIAQAIDYAVSMGARVINMSFTFDKQSRAVKWATAAAANAGAVLVSSSGNTGRDEKRYPANHHWVVGVGSTNLYDQRSAFSTEGHETFKVGAPGENLVTSFPGGLYAAVSGTSFSAAVVSGAMALVSRPAPAMDWDGAREMVDKAPFAPISEVGRDTHTLKHPQRIIVPAAIDVAAEYENKGVRRIKIPE